MWKLTRDIVVYGIQGSGKTTQLEQLVPQTDGRLFYTGGALRQRAACDDELGRQISQIINTGAHVPPAIIATMLTDFLQKVGVEQHAIFDSPARNLEQQKIFDEIMAQAQRDFVLVVLDLDEQTARKRLAHQCGRDDKTAAAIARRLQEFAEKTQPVLENYAAAGRMVLRVDAAATVSEVAQNLQNKLLKNGILV